MSLPISNFSYGVIFVIFTENTNIMLQKRILIVLALVLFSSFQLHTYYISTMNVNYSAHQKSLQTIIRVFIDDLEETINKKNHTSIRIDTEKEVTIHDSTYHDYLKKHVQFMTNDKQVSFQYIGSKFDEDMLVFYLEVPYLDTLQKLSIKNNVLMDFEEAQQTILKVKAYEKQYRYILTYDSPEKDIDL